MSGSYGGFSASATAKHEEAEGKSTSNEKSQHTQNEPVVFEAVGGNTILANNRPEWCATVGDVSNWRVINVSVLQPQ